MTTYRNIISELTDAIPAEIIDILNKKERNERFQITNERFISNLFNKLVLKDLNVFHGRRINVRGQDLELISRDIEGLLYRIPRTVLGDKGLIDAIEFTQSMTFNDSKASQLEYAKELPYTSGSADVEVVGKDLIYIYSKEFMYTFLGGTYNYTLYATVGYSDNLSEISMRYSLEIADYALEKIKAHIHNKLRISNGDASIYHGYNMPGITAYINECADSRLKAKGMRDDLALMLQQDDNVVLDYIIRYSTTGY